MCDDRDLFVCLRNLLANEGCDASALRHYDEAVGISNPARSGLTLVTAENAAQFVPAPKKRGRKPKVVLGGNVVALHAVAAKIAPPRPAPCDRMLEAEVRGVAMANLVRDLRQSETTGAPMRMNFQQHIAAAWRDRGYAPPGDA